jgi:hypothetical protein
MATNNAASTNESILAIELDLSPQIRTSRP